MNAILITVTALSLSVTALLSVLLVRALREERRRSDARVRLLSELAGLDSNRLADPAPFAEVELRPANMGSVEIAALFDHHEAPSAWPRRVAGAAAFAAILVLAALGWSLAADRDKTASAAAAVPIPLELLSLTHRQEDGALTISGLVQNPQRAAARANVEAAALVFGADGVLLASGKAPLDLAVLPPGHESPFVIHVATAGAARYRVSFHAGDGQALPHLDRRTQSAIARKELP
jgi:hypothetical protein